MKSSTKLIISTDEFDGFIRNAEDVDVFVGFGEGILQEEDWAFFDERPDL